MVLLPRPHRCCRAATGAGFSYNSKPKIEYAETGTDNPAYEEEFPGTDVNIIKAKEQRIAELDAQVSSRQGRARQAFGLDAAVHHQKELPGTMRVTYSLSCARLCSRP